MPAFSPPRLRALREHRRLSREALALRIGKAGVSIEKFERGDNYPSAPTLGLLADALGVTVSDLFDEGVGDPRDRYVQAVCDLLPPLSDEEIERFAGVIRARRSAPTALGCRERAVGV